MIQETDPLGKSVTVTYDDAGRPTSRTDRLGRRQDFTYDAVGRPTEVAWINPGGSTEQLLTYAYDAAGNRIKAAGPPGTTTFTYDSRNFLIGVKQPFNQVLTYNYDAVGNRTRTEDSLGGILTSTYDAASRLTRRDFGGSGQTPLRIDQTYTTRDQVETQTRYSDLSGTTKVASTTYTYDAGLRLTNLQQRNGSGTLLSNTTYTYDAASRLTAETRNGTATTYTYDATNQLTHDGTTTYSYDLNGNRTMPGYTTGTGNRLSSDGTWTFSFDGEGNLTGKTKGAGLETWAYTYDHDNHLKSVRQTSNGTTDILRVTYSYDSLGQRVQEDKWKTGVGSATTRFVYDGDDVWADLDGTNTLQTRYLRGDNVDEVFARVKSTGAAGWYLTDRLGSVRDVTDASGTVVDHLDYSGFGVVTESNASAGDRYKWTGREYDGDTGLQYNRARYYDGGVGRWTSEDPLGFAAGDGNLYRYVFNGAVNYVDPSGLVSFHWSDLTGPVGWLYWEWQLWKQQSKGEDLTRKRVEYDEKMGRIPLIENRVRLRGEAPEAGILVGVADPTYKERMENGSQQAITIAKIGEVGQSIAPNLATVPGIGMSPRGMPSAGAPARPITDPARLLPAPRRQQPVFPKPWSEMSQAERAAFQHAFDRHGGELGLPRWTHSNAEALRTQYNQAVAGVRSQAQSVRFERWPVGQRGSGVPGQWKELRIYEYTNAAGVRFYYAETMDGVFVSSGRVP